MRLSEGGSESRQLWRWRASSGTGCLLAPAGRWRVVERSHFDVFVLGAQVEDGRSSEQTGPQGSQSAARQSEETHDEHLEAQDMSMRYDSGAEQTDQSEAEEVRRSTGDHQHGEARAAQQQAQCRNGSSREERTEVG